MAKLTAPSLPAHVLSLKKASTRVPHILAVGSKVPTLTRPKRRALFFFFFGGRREGGREGAAQTVQKHRLSDTTTRDVRFQKRWRHGGSSHIHLGRATSLLTAAQSTSLQHTRSPTGVQHPQSMAWRCLALSGASRCGQCWRLPNELRTA